MRLLINDKENFHGIEGLGTRVNAVGRWTIEGCKGPLNLGSVDHGRWAEEITLNLLMLISDLNRDPFAVHVELEDIDDERLVWTLKMGEKTTDLTGEEIKEAQTMKNSDKIEKRHVKCILKDLVLTKFK